MAIISALLALVGRALGKILNTVFGWETMMLFGKIPSDRQIYLSVNVFGSVIWLALLIGIAVPSAGVFLLSFVTLPAGIDKEWLRLAMAAIVIALPAAIGLISMKMIEPGRLPPNAASKLNFIAKGYPYTAGLALTLLLMTLLVPVIKISTFLKGWTSDHMPIIVAPEDYAATVDNVTSVLNRRGYAAEKAPAGWMLAVPTKIFLFFAGGSVKEMTTGHLTLVRAENLEVLLHPSDLMISGKKFDVVHVRAILTEELAFSKAHMTWSKEANEMEAEMADLNQAMGRLHSEQIVRSWKKIDDRLKNGEITFEEWEILFLKKILLQRNLCQALNSEIARK